MKLKIENYPTPSDKTCDLVDEERDGGEGRPLIVARIFEPQYRVHFVLIPEMVRLLRTCRKSLMAADRSEKWKADRSATLHDVNNLLDELKAKEVAS